MLSRIAKHLEAKDDSYLPKTEVYNIYLENCIASNTYAVEVSSFIKVITSEIYHLFHCDPP